MKKISYTHILLNLILQIISWLILTIAFCAVPLIEFYNDSWPADARSFETAWLVRLPPPDDEWHIYYKFITGELNCDNYNLPEAACSAIHRSVLSNNILLLCYILGTTAAFGSMIWTYYQM